MKIGGENTQKNHRRSLSLSHWNTQLSVPMEKETELEKRLYELIQSIDETGFIDETTIGKLFIAIFELKSERNKIPAEFICPLSKKMMTDPVVNASGQTFDRSAVTQKLGSSGTNDEAIMPNRSVLALILKWCKTHGVLEPVQHRANEKPTDSDETFFIDTIEKMNTFQGSWSLKFKNLLRLTREIPVFRALYGQHPQVIERIINSIPPESHLEIDPVLYEDLMAILLNISADERNRLAVLSCPLTIPCLIQALKAKRLEIRCNAAATIHQISLIDESKEVIGKSDVLKLLIELLKEKWSPQATIDAMNAISSLCENKANVGRAVLLGAAPVVADKIKNGTFADKLLHMLKRFVVYRQACEELVRFKYIPMLLSIVRENSSDESKENALSILCTVFNHNRGLWVELVKKIEQNRGIITQISQTGTTKAKIKANAMLDSLNKETTTSSSITHP